MSESIKARVWEWLSDAGSLSQRLRLFTGGCIQHVLRKADWGLITQDEQNLLSLALNTDSIREIEWHYHNTTWIQARVVIPKSTLQGAGCELQEITHRPLGDTLFRDPHLKRSDFIYEAYPFSLQCAHVRRSIFYYYHQPLLVSETFLPAFFSAVEQKSCS